MLAKFAAVLNYGREITKMVLVSYLLVFNCNWVCWNCQDNYPLCSEKRVLKFLDIEEVGLFYILGGTRPYLVAMLKSVFGSIDQLSHHLVKCTHQKKFKLDIMWYLVVVFCFQTQKKQTCFTQKQSLGTGHKCRRIGQDLSRFSSAHKPSRNYFVLMGWF